jgi:hypothetical protein
MGDLLLVTLVLGLSCANMSLRWGARLVIHSSRSSESEVMVRKDMSCATDAGYNSASTLERIRDRRNRARALESLVDSPGSVGKNPFSVTYSSSASTGYSQCTSSSLKSFGRPRCAAEKLDRVSESNYSSVGTHLPVYGVK